MTTKESNKHFGPEFVYWSTRKPKLIRLRNQLLSNDSLDSPLVAARMDSGAAGLIRVVVSNGRAFDVECGRDTRVQEIFDAIVQQLVVVEHFYFGLAWLSDEEEYYFLDHSDTIQDVAPEDWLLGQVASFKLLFLMKFYMRDETAINNPTTRQLLYSQIRQDILSDRTDCSEEDAIVLGAIAMQCEYGDHSAQLHFDVKHFVPETVVEYLGAEIVANELRMVHHKYAGTSRPDALAHFIREAAKISDYGVYYYKAYSSLGDLCLLGISSKGFSAVLIDEEFKSTICDHDWTEVTAGRIQHQRLLLGIAPEKITADNRFKGDDSPASEMAFVTDTTHKALYLLGLCNMQFKFFHALRARSRDWKERPVIPNLFSAVDPNVFIDEADKRITLSDPNALPSPNERPMNVPTRHKSSPDPSEVSSSPEKEPRRVSTVTLRGRQGDFGVTLVSKKIDQLDLGVFVRKVEKGSPAEREGLKKGDRVLAINGTSLEGLSEKKANKMLDGSGETAELIVSRVSSKEPQKPPRPSKADSDIWYLSKNPVQPDRRETEDPDAILEGNDAHLPDLKSHFVDEDSLQSFNADDLVKRNVEDKAKYTIVPKTQLDSFFELSQGQKSTDKTGKGSSNPIPRSVAKSSGSEAESQQAVAQRLAASDDLTSVDDFDGFDYPPITESEKRKEQKRIWAAKDGRNTAGAEYGESTLEKGKPASSVRSPEDEVFLDPLGRPEPMSAYHHGDVYTVDLMRINGGLGLTLCENAAQSGLFVRSLYPDGAADLDGRIKPGDRVVSIHQHNVEHATLKEAIRALQNAPQVARLELQRWMLPINMFFKREDSDYSFVTEDTTWTVQLIKEMSRGERDVDCLGLDVCGFSDSPGKGFGEKIPRVKTVHVGGPAQRVGHIEQGDVILAVNGEPLRDFEFERMVYLVKKSTARVSLMLCRPPPGLLAPVVACPARREGDVSGRPRSARIKVELEKEADQPLGIKFNSPKADQLTGGFTIKEITPGGIAHRDGRLQVGDVVENLTFDSPDFTVNGSTLLGSKYSDAMKLMKKSEGVLVLEIMRPAGGDYQVFRRSTSRKSATESQNLPYADQPSLEYDNHSSARDQHAPPTVRLPKSRQSPPARSQASRCGSPSWASKMISDFAAAAAAAAPVHNVAKQPVQPPVGIMKPRLERVVPNEPVAGPFLKVKGTSEYLDTQLLKKIREAKNAVLSKDWQVEFEQLNYERLTQTLSRRSADDRRRKETPVQFQPITDYPEAAQIAFDVGTHEHALYIVAQSPTKADINEFLSMVWYQRVNTIVTFGGQVAKYWPQVEDEVITLRSFEVIHSEWESSAVSEFRQLLLRNRQTGCTRKVNVFILTEWDSNRGGLPSTHDALRFVALVRRQHLTEPLLVHCADGNNQSAVVVALHVMLRLVELDRPVHIQHIVRYLRHHGRTAAVSHEESYKFLYLCFVAVLENLKLF